MGKIVTFGTDGYCEDCSPEHEHPLHNIIAEVDVPDEEPATDTQALAEALATLPPETLDALKQALGI